MNSVWKSRVWSLHKWKQTLCSTEAKFMNETISLKFLGIQYNELYNCKRLREIEEKSQCKAVGRGDCE